MTTEQTYIQIRLARGFLCPLSFHYLIDHFPEDFPRMALPREHCIGKHFTAYNILFKYIREVGTILICRAILMICLENRADQNTGGALLEFPMRTAIYGKSRVSSAISVCDN